MVATVVPIALALAGVFLIWEAKNMVRQTGGVAALAVAGIAWLA